MEICRDIAAVRALTGVWRAGGAQVGFVPTMGALHRGHLALVARAREAVGAQGRVVVSIFVNPTQFGPNEDFDRYPRDEAGDVALLRDAGADAVFLPSVADIYPEGAQTIVEVTGLSRLLMGRLRPGHFRGVATVVTKLFNIVQPDVACFGEKDFQQLAVIRRMVADLHTPVQILAVPTVREADGLAMSSRNARLTPEDRAAAPVLAQAMAEGAALLASGAPLFAARRAMVARVAAEPRADLRSLDLRDAATLAQLPAGPLDRPGVILIAARFGDVLLIDQRVVERNS